MRGPYGVTHPPGDSVNVPDTCTQTNARHVAPGVGGNRHAPFTQTHPLIDIDHQPRVHTHPGAGDGGGVSCLSAGGADDAFEV